MAAAPSVAKQTSKRWKGLAIMGEARTSSAVYGPRSLMTAPGFLEPALRIVAASSAKRVRSGRYRAK
jgi:hypothetical protein